MRPLRTLGALVILLTNNGCNPNPEDPSRADNPKPISVTASRVIKDNPPEVVAKGIVTKLGANRAVCISVGDSESWTVRVRQEDLVLDKAVGYRSYEENMPVTHEIGEEVKIGEDVLILKVSQVVEKDVFYGISYNVIPKKVTRVTAAIAVPQR